MNEVQAQNNYPRKTLAVIVFTWLLVVFSWKFFSNALLHQLHQPVLISPEIDNIYWIYHLLQIPEWLTQHRDILFDLMLFAFIIVCIFFSRIWILPLLLVIFLWTYYITFNTFAGHHYYQVGYLFIAIPFIAKGEKSFNFLWEAVRYYCCFLYASSGLYKLFRGSIFHSEQMQSILMNDNASELYNNAGFHSDVILWFIQHKTLSHTFFIGATIIELALFIGFFTKKYDLWLLISLLVFHMGNYFLVGISFLEQAVIFLALVPKEKWNLLRPFSAFLQKG